MGTYGSVILLGSYEHRDACWGNAPRRFTEEILNSVTPRYSLVGHGFIQSRSCLHGGRQSGRVTSFFVASPLPHTSHHKLLQNRKPWSDGSRASLIHPKKPVSKLSRIRGGKPQEHGGSQGIHSTTADRLQQSIKPVHPLLDTPIRGGI